MLRQRLISGLILSIGLVSLILFLPKDYLIYFMALLTAISLWEFLSLRFSAIISIISICCCLALFYLSQFLWLNKIFLGLNVLTYVGLFFLILSFPVSKPLIQRNSFWLISGVFIHVGFFSSLYFLINQEDLLLGFGMEMGGRTLLLLIILISVLMDSIAYFGGKKYGNTKLLPNVSPNKTFEGFILAIIITPLVVLLITGGFVEKGFYKFIILILIASFTSVIGDATISLFKRVAEVKDTGNLIPGHGGLLDRMDSHIATIPMFLFILFLM
tara:strand:+ start:10985 stop:11800 length:816 start_codon:yes stop_codon:yes gene_type:complete